MTDRIHILQVVQGLDFGGLERVVCNLAKFLDPQRFQCDVLCLRHFGRNADELKNSGITVTSFDMGRGKNLSIPRQLAALIQRGKYHIVHSHDTTPLLYTALAKIFHSKFLHVYTEHSGIYSCLSRHRLMTGVALCTVEHAVMVSQDLLNYYKSHFHFPQPEMSLIYNGLEFIPAPLDARASVCREFDIPPQSLVIGTAVRFYPQKGLRYLIEAIPLILQKNPEARFLLVGDGVERQMLEQLADNSGVRNNIIFTGYRSDISRLIGAMDVYVLPSLWEGLPLSLIEALMVKKAIVATAVGGNRELVEDGVSGFIVPPRDSTSMANKINLLLGSERLRCDMAERGSIFAHDNFKLEQMIHSYENLFANLTGK